MKASLLALAALGAVMAYAVPTEPSSVVGARALDGGTTLDFHTRNVEHHEPHDLPASTADSYLKRALPLKKRQSVAVTNSGNR